MTEQSNYSPVDRIRIWPLTAAIWKQTNSEDRPYYTFTIDRSYKKGESYESTSSFGLNDALLLAKLADRVDTRIRELAASDTNTAPK